MTAQESRPVHHSERPSQQLINVTTGSVSQVPDGQLPDVPDLLTSEDWADLVSRVSGALVVVVRTSAGRYRRRVYLSLSAAEAARDRAVERGHDAVLTLCELRPVVIGNG